MTTIYQDDDQPTTCPKCGARTDWVDATHDGEAVRANTCLGCGFQFLSQDDEDMPKNNIASLYVSLYRKDDLDFQSDEQAAMALIVAMDGITKAIASGDLQGDIDTRFAHGHWEIIRRDEG